MTTFGPEKNELEVLECTVKAYEKEGSPGCTKCIYLTYGLGVGLLTLVYVLEVYTSTEPFIKYSLSTFGGILLGMGILLTRYADNTELMRKYVKLEKIKLRIAELKR